MKRRDFLAATAAVAAFPGRAPLRWMADAPPHPLAASFDLSHVRLLPGPFLDAA